MSTVTDKLIVLNDAKADMKAALVEKGVEPTGGLNTYADAIRSIENREIIFEGGIDYTQIGYTTDESIAQNTIDSIILADDIVISKEVMDYYKNGWTKDRWMSYYMPKIKYMPIISLSSTDLEFMFGSSVGREKPKCEVFPSINTRNVYRMSYMFSGNTHLRSVGLLDCGNVSYINSMFSGCSNLVHLDGFVNLGYSLSKRFSAADTVLDLSSSTKLSKQSILNVINNIASPAIAGVEPILRLASSHLKELSSADIAIATNKGWTVESY